MSSHGQKLALSSSVIRGATCSTSGAAGGGGRREGESVFYITATCAPPAASSLRARFDQHQMKRMVEAGEQLFVVSDSPGTASTHMM